VGEACWCEIVTVFARACCDVQLALECEPDEQPEGRIKEVHALYSNPVLGKDELNALLDAVQVVSDYLSSEDQHGPLVK
jgi:hypothetical protein